MEEYELLMIGCNYLYIVLLQLYALGLLLHSCKVVIYDLVIVCYCDLLKQKGKQRTHSSKGQLGID